MRHATCNMHPQLAACNNPLQTPPTCLTWCAWANECNFISSSSGCEIARFLLATLNVIIHAHRTKISEGRTTSGTRKLTSFESPLHLHVWNGEDRRLFTHWCVDTRARSHLCWHLSCIVSCMQRLSRDCTLTHRCITWWFPDHGFEQIHSAYF